MKKARSYLQHLLTVPRLVAWSISPNRQWIAWEWGNVNKTKTVFFVPTDGSQTLSEVAMVNPKQNVHYSRTLWPQKCH